MGVAFRRRVAAASRGRSIAPSVWSRCDGLGVTPVPFQSPGGMEVPHTGVGYLRVYMIIRCSRFAGFRSGANSPRPRSEYGKRGPRDRGGWMLGVTCAIAVDAVFAPPSVAPPPPADPWSGDRLQACRRRVARHHGWRREHDEHGTRRDGIHQRGFSAHATVAAGPTRAVNAHSPTTNDRLPVHV